MGALEVEMDAIKSAAKSVSAASVRSALLQQPFQDELIGDQMPLLAHFFPPTLGVIVVKASIIGLSGRYGAVQKRLFEMEEEGEDPDLADVLAPSRHQHELSIWKGFGLKLREGVLRDLAIYSVQRVYEIFALEFVVERKVFKSLVKNIARSSVRKWDRYQSSGLAMYAGKVGVSAFKGQLLFWLALFTVNQGVDTYYTFFSRGAGAGASGAPGAGNDAVVGVDVHRTETYAKRLVLNALRCATACALAAVGAAVGAAVKPGVGATIGFSIAPQFAFALI